MIARAFRVTPLAALLASIVLTSRLAGAALPSATAQAEISHLLSHLQSSRCEFYRNGVWHDSRAAREHLEKKKNYLMKRSAIGSAEDFIALAATASSVSGEKYQVRCRPGSAVPSGEWLLAELERFRAERGPQGKTGRP